MSSLFSCPMPVMSLTTLTATPAPPIQTLLTQYTKCDYNQSWAVNWSRGKHFYYCITDIIVNVQSQLRSGDFLNVRTLDWGWELGLLLRHLEEKNLRCKTNNFFVCLLLQCCKDARVLFLHPAFCLSCLVPQLDTRFSRGTLLLEWPFYFSNNFHETCLQGVTCSIDLSNVITFE